MEKKRFREEGLGEGECSEGYITRARYVRATWVGEWLKVSLCTLISTMRTGKLAVEPGEKRDDGEENSIVDETFLNVSSSEQLLSTPELGLVEEISGRKGSVYTAHVFIRVQ